MKRLRMTQKQYDDLNGIYGGLVLLAIRILIGIILSFLNAYLTYSHISWGFQIAYAYPVIFIMLGFLYFIDAILLFNKKRAFIAMYVITAAAFILTNASFSGYGFLIYAGFEVLIIMYLMKSKRAAVNFRTKRIEITDKKYAPSSFILPAMPEGLQNGVRNNRPG